MENPLLSSQSTTREGSLSCPLCAHPTCKLFDACALYNAFLELKNLTNEERSRWGSNPGPSKYGWETNAKPPSYPLCYNSLNVTALHYFEQFFSFLLLLLLLLLLYIEMNNFFLSCSCLCFTLLWTIFFFLLLLLLLYIALNNLLLSHTLALALAFGLYCSEQSISFSFSG